MENQLDEGRTRFSNDNTEHKETAATVEEIY